MSLIVDAIGHEEEGRDDEDGGIGRIQNVITSQRITFQFRHLDYSISLPHQTTSYSLSTFYTTTHLLQLLIHSQHNLSIQPIALPLPNRTLTHLLPTRLNHLLSSLCTNAAYMPPSIFLITVTSRYTAAPALSCTNAPKSYSSGSVRRNFVSEWRSNASERFVGAYDQPVHVFLRLEVLGTEHVK